MAKSSSKLTLKPFEELLNRDFGAPGTPEREAFDKSFAEFKKKQETNPRGYPTDVPSQKELAKELQERLVQTCIDFIREKGDEFIWRVDFSADSLHESAEEGKWMPCTDSFISLEALVWDENLKTVVRKEIGSYE